MPDDTDAVVNDLAAVINKHSLENASNTPDFILAQFLNAVLGAWNKATAVRDDWYDAKVKQPADEEAKAMERYRLSLVSIANAEAKAAERWRLSLVSIANATGQTGEALVERARRALGWSPVSKPVEQPATTEAPQEPPRAQQLILEHAEQEGGTFGSRGYDAADISALTSAGFIRRTGSEGIFCLTAKGREWCEARARHSERKQEVIREIADRLFNDRWPVSRERMIDTIVRDERVQVK